MATSDRDRWDAKYRDRSEVALSPPDDWLQRHIHLAEQPSSTRTAMDVACGLGQNAIWLAQRGWHVDAIDISAVGLNLAASLAESTTVSWIEADMDDYQPQPAKYDLVTVFRFIDRERLPGLIETALRPGGILIYETFSQQQLAREDNHLKNPRYALGPGELGSLFPRLKILAQEDVELQDRSVTRLVAQKL